MLKVMYVEFDAMHKGNFVFDMPDGQNSWLLLLTHTPALFLVDDVLVQAQPNSVVLYKPGQRIYYRACDKQYSNDWIRFVTDEEYVTETSIPGGVPFTVSNNSFLHKLYQLITAEHERDAEMNEAIIDKLLQLMFLKLSESFDHKPATQFYKNLNDLRTQIYKRPSDDWTVKLMADRLNISVGHLEKLYRSSFDVTCMEDVIQSRIGLAKKHLEHGDFSIAEIVSMCGYHSVEHFYRQFKRTTGLTPKQYQTHSSRNAGQGK